jgi:hypothetical protein
MVLLHASLIPISFPGTTAVRTAVTLEGVLGII